MISAQVEPTFWALTGRSAKDALRLYFDPLYRLWAALSEPVKHVQALAMLDLMRTKCVQARAMIEQMRAERDEASSILEQMRTERDEARAILEQMRAEQDDRPIAELLGPQPHLQPFAAARLKLRLYQQMEKMVQEASLAEGRREDRQEDLQEDRQEDRQWEIMLLVLQGRLKSFTADEQRIIQGVLDRSKKEKSSADQMAKLKRLQEELRRQGEKK